ncbi:MAG: hypothetical protein JXB62_00075 [Pirellulales bacterium]|nr:hypothetical protein [Pirellulales bacterium]
MNVLRIAGVLALLTAACLLPWADRLGIGETLCECSGQVAASAPMAAPVQPTHVTAQPSGTNAPAVQTAVPTAVAATPSPPLPGLFDGSVKLDALSLAELKGFDQALSQETRKVAQAYAEASDDDKAAAELKDKLTETVRVHFNIRRETRLREIQELEAQVEKLRGQVSKWTASENSIVEMRVEQFVRAAEGLGWDGGSATEGRSRIGAAGGGFGVSGPAATRPTSVRPSQRSRSTGRRMMGGSTGGGISGGGGMAGGSGSSGGSSGSSGGSMGGVGAAGGSSGGGAISGGSSGGGARRTR